MLVLQASLALAVLLLAFTRPQIAEPWLSRFETRFSSFARHKRASIILVGTLALVLRVAALPVEPVPHPRIDDEYSYLLAGDTFSHGRLANPTPAMWRHMETFHELMRPTYASMYPPAQGMFLAIGKLATGLYFSGVLLSVALMCAVICWMLQGWVEPQWALVGGLISIAQFGVFSYWADSYWGGAPAAIGGALVLGAFARIKNLQKPLHAFILGFGLLILANSRPYEGLVFAAPVLIALLIWIAKQKGAAFGSVLRRVLIPFAITCLVAGLATGYYYWRITGNPFQMPQALNRKIYASTPYFIWQHLKPAKQYNNPALADLYNDFELNAYNGTRGVRILSAWASDISTDWCFYVGPLLTLPLVFAMAAAPYGMGWRDIDSNTRLLIAIWAATGAGLALEIFHANHYSAPLTGAIVALLVIALRYGRSLRIGTKPVGKFLSRAVSAASFVVILAYACLLLMHFSFALERSNFNFPWLLPQSQQQQIRATLSQTADLHLLIVHYTPGVQFGWVGWVENEADIDHSRIVWAWDLGPEKNRELLDYYKDRRVWLVNTADNPPHLIPYPRDPAQASPRN